MKVSMIEEEMKLFKEADCKSASTDQIVVSDKVPEPCYAPNVANVPTATYQKKTLQITGYFV